MKPRQQWRGFCFCVLLRLRRVFAARRAVICHLLFARSGTHPRKSNNETGPIGWRTFSPRMTTSFISIRDRKAVPTTSAHNVYTIIARMPIEADGRIRYRIRSKTENVERVVTEDQLSRPL